MYPWKSDILSEYVVLDYQEIVTTPLLRVFKVYTIQASYILKCMLIDSDKSLELANIESKNWLSALKNHPSYLTIKNIKQVHDQLEILLSDAGECMQTMRINYIQISKPINVELLYKWLIESLGCLLNRSFYNGDISPATLFMCNGVVKLSSSHSHMDIPPECVNKEMPVSIYAFFPEFSPPEVLNSKDGKVLMNPHKANIYTLGLIFLILLKSASNEHLRAITESRKNEEQHQLIIEDALKSQDSNKCVKIESLVAYKEALRMMLSYNPDYRPTAKRLYYSLCGGKPVNLKDIMEKSDDEVDQQIVQLMTAMVCQESQQLLNINIEELKKERIAIKQQITIINEIFDKLSTRVKKLEEAKSVSHSFSFGEKTPPKKQEEAKQASNN